MAIVSCATGQIARMEMVTVSDEELLIESATVALENVGIGLRFLDNVYADSTGRVSAMIVELQDLKGE